MCASPIRQRCDLVIVTAETMCADILHAESLYDGSQLTLLLRLTYWHMWASHTAFIAVHALRTDNAPGNAPRDARLVAAVVLKLAPVVGGCPQSDRLMEDRGCLQTISARWMYSLAGVMLFQRRDDDDDRAVRALRYCGVAPYNSTGSNDPGGDNNTPSSLY